MRFIHCADFHLDSALTQNLVKEKSKIRKIEILNTYERMVEYAIQNNVDAILLSGDIFDTSSVKRKTLEFVKRLIKDNPQIDFYYLRGNHDKEVELFDSLPDNLKLFSEKWTTYTYDDFTISGIELSEKQEAESYISLDLPKEKINIVMLHGQISSSHTNENEINLNLLKNKYIDYLALGHIHSYSFGEIDSRGIWAYSGCPDGRGYDETGSKGFVLIDIDNGSITHSFIPFESRLIEDVAVDITDDEDISSIYSHIDTFLKTIDKKSMVKLRIRGKLNMETFIDTEYIEEKYSDRFFHFKIENETSIKYDAEDYIHDATLKGEFIRNIFSLDCSDEEKREIIETGLKALAGEEL